MVFSVGHKLRTKAGFGAQTDGSREGGREKHRGAIAARVVERTSAIDRGAYRDVRLASPREQLRR